ncbi:MAG: transglutaminase-like domain-containing protein [Candidatus Micrarchaeia archaeon]
MFLDKRIFAFILLLLVGRAFAQSNGDFSPFLVKSANYTLLEDHQISSTDGSISKILLNISIPQNSQVTNSSSNYSKEISADGNSYLIVSDSSPSDPYSFSASFFVRSFVQTTSNLSGVQSANSSFESYIASNEQVPSDNESLRSLAQNISANYKTDFEKISALAIWTNKYITYNLSYAGKDLSVYEILSQRAGICSDYSLLFTTLSRSLGYPTRFVNGYAYSSVQKEWVGHSWTEVYLGKWVPVDPTWLEVGFLDGTHVPISKLASYDYKLASVSANVLSKDARIIWQGPEGQSEPATNLKVKSIEFFEPDSNYLFGVSSKNLSQDSKFIIYAMYNASDYRVINIVPASCKSDSGQILTFDKGEQFTITSPSKEQITIWAGNISGEIEPNILYKCPITLNSDFLSPKSITLDILLDDKPAKTLSAAVFKPSISPYEHQKVMVSMPSDFANKNATLLADNFLMSTAFDKDGAAEFEFPAGEIGAHKLYVWADGAQPIELDYICDIGFANKSITIDFVNLTYSGQDGLVNIQIPAEFAAMIKGPISIAWNWGAQSGQLQISNTSFSQFVFSPELAASYPFSVQILDASSNKVYSQSSPLSISQKPFMWVSNMKISNLNSTHGLIQIQISKKGDVKNAWLLMGGKRYPVGSNEIHLELEKKAYIGKIIWEDPYGKSYFEQVFIRTPDENDPWLTPGIMTSEQNRLSLYQILIELGAIVAILLIAEAVRRSRSGANIP